MRNYHLNQTMRAVYSYPLASLYDVKQIFQLAIEL